MSKALTAPSWDKRSVTFDAIEKLAAPVGRIVTAWTYIDQNIDIWVRAALAMEIGPRPAFPRNFDDKLKYLRKANQRHGVREEAAAIANEILARIRAAAKVRHSLCHWTLTHFEEEDGAIVFTKLEHDEVGRPSAKEAVYTLAMLSKQYAEIVRTAKAVQAIAFTLTDLKASSIPKVGQ